MGGRAAAWAIAAVVLAAALALWAIGRSPICPCGTVALWHGAVNSDENSQQIGDWYSLSHVVHGLLFYAGSRAVLRRHPVAMRLLVAVAIEAAWEVLENSPMVIDRYGAVTLAFGYSGDSILNSLADIGCMMLGFWAARRLPPWGSIVAGLLLELVALAAIRDNLTLNVWMLAAPNPAVRAWQAAGP